VDDLVVKAILDARTQDPNVIAEQLSRKIRVNKLKNDTSFFSRVDKLKAYKEEHGHLNVREKDSLSLYKICNHVRNSRRAIIAGEGKICYSLDDN
jgi:hypothetical protein